ncbi:MAG: TIGR02594 family protein [Rhizobium sp.]|nr:TIGR02594 family protein [Rhizobium sp.]
MTRTIIDTPYSVKARAHQLAALGIRCIIRYYNRQNSQAFPDKRLTRPEAEAIVEAGMSIAVVFQQNHRLITDFTGDWAEKDAEAALKCAGDVGQPTGSTIYVAVDHDFVATADLTVIAGYFESVGATVRSRGYKIGVYGSGRVAGDLKSRGLVDHVWLACPLGWSGSRAYLKDGDWNLYQDAIGLKIDGLDCDSNITPPGLPDFGQFTLSPARSLPLAQTLDAASARNLYEVDARGSLNLRGGPALDYPVIRTLSGGTRLYGLQRSGSWIQVDLEGDGRPDGYVSLDYLLAVTGDTADLPVTGMQAIDIAYREYEMQVGNLDGPGTNPRIALYYRRLDGAANGHDDDEVAWCSYFVNFCFSELGQKGSGRADARSWLTWGKPVQGAPRRGDVVVLWREAPDSWKGHVGFFVGYDADQWLLLGGNQDDAVSIKAYDPARVLGVRRL